jgi:hypothetical protein
MTARLPGNDLLFGRGINSQRINGRHLKTRHSRTVGIACFRDVRNKALSILLEVRMENETVRASCTFDGCSDVEGDIRLG